MQKTFNKKVVDKIIVSRTRSKHILQVDLDSANVSGFRKFSRFSKIVFFTVNYFGSC